MYLHKIGKTNLSIPVEQNPAHSKKPVFKE